MIINDYKKADETVVSSKTLYFIISTFLADLEGENILLPTNFLRRFSIACLKHLSFRAFSDIQLTTQKALALFNDNCNSRKIVEYRKTEGTVQTVWLNIDKR